MISNCGHDENGTYSGGRAGDQTGSEWEIRSWYSRPWTSVFRYPLRAARDLIAELAAEAAENDKIGYDQGNRTSFWTQLKKSNYRPKDITVACETDCSAGVAAIVKATGYILNIPELKDVSIDMHTGSETMELISAGFTQLTDAMFLDSDRYLLPGDILLCKGHHTAINLSTGSAVDQEQHWRWIKSGGKWYYQDQNGQNWHGWGRIKETNGPYYHWYWFDSKGAAATGAKEIDGKWYFFQPDGDMECAECITDPNGAMIIWSMTE